ncbi:beta-1-4-galactosyltransferase 7 [Brachionus plicatilis]|uniref:Beta-1-4-galactosyltransferase 7 n=1 Tax=Brachionus plicatilis TaxID=10195 RepID=A0A3M7S6P2_BRAPC|nr:beta-1-4-galactosyltransferase 7 [Brachionus plicatilis]
MQSTFGLHSEKETPIGFMTIEHENLKLRDENRKLKEENERLKENLKNVIFHSDELSKLLKSLSLEPENPACSNMDQSIMFGAKKNPYEEYENRPAKSRLTMNHEWDWENKPIKPTSILVNQSSIDYQRRRSKSVCFGERNLIHELIEMENNRSTDQPDNKMEVEKEEKQTNKRLDSSEEENLPKDKPSKKVKSKKIAPKPAANKIVSKITIQPRIYNLDTSSESNQNEIQNEKPVTLPSNKCNCNGDCLTNRCSCKKSLTGCSSRCHNGNPCKNLSALKENKFLMKRNVCSDPEQRLTPKKISKHTQTTNRTNLVNFLMAKLKQNLKLKSNLFFFLFGLITNRKLAVVVPFRDRFEELIFFVPHISKFLHSKSINFKIFIVNQVDSYRFNRASLINIGFLVSMNECDYMAMHDVDLLPLSEKLDYSYPLKGPFHVSTPGLHPEYNYSTFIGGILIITKEDFIHTNGMSNRYWGWGREDDEFYLRLQKANITVQRPNLRDFTTGRNFTFFNNHNAEKRKRDKKRFLKQKKESLVRDHTGLDTIQYRLHEKKEILIDKFVCTVVNVELFCDRYDTHWCNMDYQFF